MLHRYFLERNCDDDKDEHLAMFFENLPFSRQDLTIDRAITIICDYHRKLNHLDKNEPVTIFIGVDEFTRLSDVNCTCHLSKKHIML